MKNYLKYEFKKNLWAFLIIMVLCALPYIIEMSTFEMAWNYEYYDEFDILKPGRQIATPPLATMSTQLIALCFIVPILTYSFKMNKRSVDAYYSLPIKKEKLYFVKTLVGLFLTLTPFTVAYWSGFFVLLCREGNPYSMGWYVPAYFGLLILGFFLYGFNSFLFTRANKVGDGVVFMLSYAFMGAMAISYIDFNFIKSSLPYWVEETFLSFGGISLFTSEMARLIKNFYTGGNVNLSIWSFAYPVLTGAIGYFLMFYLLRFEKAEDAEQVSDSWFGYRVIIPYYAAFLLGASYDLPLFTICLVLIAEITATIVYRRKFLFEKKNWIHIGVGLGAGLILFLLTLL